MYVSSGRSARSVAAELGVPQKTLETWIRSAKIAAIDPDGTLPRDQLIEILRLRRENTTLKREVDFLKKADAFFRESDPNANGSR